mmetsp:Transcript_29789/g.64924  ORF Transcript_29789/g.64924 Transcript_29789/m.64924 type:complete len:517 (-) Transcript_29789:195-1745(-)
MMLPFLVAAVAAWLCCGSSWVFVSLEAFESGLPRSASGSVPSAGQHLPLGGGATLTGWAATPRLQAPRQSSAFGSQALCGAVALAALSAAAARAHGKRTKSGLGFGKPRHFGLKPSLIGRKVVESVALPNGSVRVSDTGMPYAQFMPRFYNWCISLGMTCGQIVPSIGFCADENQGYPTALILKHFGTWPFNHGYIGGILALDRHGPHAAHGEDMVIFVAPHVGYNTDTQTFGTYRRIQVATQDEQISTCCGKIAGVLAAYREQYNKTPDRIKVCVRGEKVLVSLSDSISRDATDGHYICLVYDQLLAPGAIENPLYLESTSKVYQASEGFSADIREAIAASGYSKKKSEWRTLSDPILRKAFKPNMFTFKAPPLDGEANRLERLLLPHMSYILGGPVDAELMSAMICAQAEFGRAKHSVESEPAYKGKNLVVISGINIDVSPEAGDEQAFPSTVFLPWSAYIQIADGRKRVLEQAELVEALIDQSDYNMDAIDIEQCVEELFTAKKEIIFYDKGI